MQVMTYSKILPTSAREDAKASKWEDVVYKPVADAVKKSTTVVYNHFNIEAILAARILKQCYPDFEVVSVAQIIDVTSELYIWIGVDPTALMTKEMVDLKEHRQYSTHNTVMSDEKVSEYEDDFDRIGLIEQVCKDFMVVPNPHIYRMSFLAARFYGLGMTLTDLSSIYYDVVESIDFLKGIKELSQPVINPRPSMAAMMDDYMETVRRIKLQFNKNYRDTYVMDGEREIKAIHTTFSENDFVIALRFMKMTHNNFINRTASMNGDLIYSSMKDPKLNVNDNQKVILLN